MLTDKATEILTQMQQAATKVAPQALDLAVKTTYRNAVGHLILGAGLLIVALILILATHKLTTGTIKEYYASDKTYATVKYETVIVIAIGGLVVSACVLLLSLVNLLDPWNWIGIFSPKLALFYDLYTRITSHN